MHQFLRKLFAISGYFFLSGSLGPGTPAKRRSKNWVWIPPDAEATDEDWKRRFERLKNAHIDALLPEVCIAGTAYFGSRHLPVKAELLERLIPIAKSFDLEIHAWMWTLPCLAKDVQKNHPDWYMVNALGQSCLEKPAYVKYYKFLCPAKEGVQNFVLETVQELSGFDIDGIHLDYVRYPDVILPKGLWAKYGIVQDKEYPQYDFCYCETCREKFKAQTGIDPLRIEEPASHQAWLQFRYDQVTHLVNNQLVPVAQKAGKQISAAVFPNWRNVRQQWPAWNLDAVMPMLYNRFSLAGADWIEHMTRAGIKSLKHDTAYYSGLMIDKPDRLQEYIRKAFAGGAGGISLFSFRGLRKEHFKMLAGVLEKY